MQDRYCKEVPLTINRGKVHDYLGMTLDFSSAKKVKILMLDYIKKLVKDLPDDFGGEAATPAANHFFEIDENAEKSDNKEGEFFHYVVAKLIFLYKRARSDLQTSVAFLSTCIKSPNVDD
eukprot:2478944-Ditylum_brightwellii.AAC.1